MKRQIVTRQIATLSGRPFAAATSNDTNAGDDKADKGGKAKAAKLTDLLAENDELQDQFDALIEKRLARERRQNPGRRQTDVASDEERQELQRLREEAAARETADLEKKKQYDTALQQVRDGYSTKEKAWQTREAQLLDELRKDRVRGQIIAAAAAAGAVDPEDVAELLEKRVTMGADFKISVRDHKDASREAFNAEGDPMSIRELVEDLLAKKTHLAKPAEGESAGARGGAAASAEGSARGGRGQQSGAVAKLQADFAKAKDAAEKHRTPAAMTKMRQAQRALEQAQKAA